MPVTCWPKKFGESRTHFVFLQWFYSYSKKYQSAIQVLLRCFQDRKQAVIGISKRASSGISLELLNSADYVVFFDWKFNLWLNDAMIFFSFVQAVSHHQLIDDFSIYCAFVMSSLALDCVSKGVNIEKPP